MRIGVDLGGSKIEIVALDDGDAVRLRRRIATPAGDYEATVAAIAALVASAEAELGACASVGVGIPGAQSLRTGLIKNANSTVLIGRSLRADLERALERPVRLENDANCFALSEARDGAAAGAACVFGVILGTGVGGGLVVDGSVLRGRTAIAGEWGHNPLPWPRDDERPGPACYCGKFGCIETFVSGTGLRADHARATGTLLDGAAIARAAAAGDAAARATMSRYVDRLARALATAINIVDPDAIVLGGGASNIDDLPAAVVARLGAYVFTDAVETTVVRALHGDSSGVRGAAWLWPRTAGRPGIRSSEGRRMDSAVEVLRLPSPAPKPQSLAYDGTTLWMGSRETKRVYAIDPKTWSAREEATAPGTPWGMTVVGDELRVLCGEPPDDNRFIRRFVPGHGFKTNDAIPCPEDTGSQLAFDGDRLYVSQWYNGKILSLDERGAVGTTIAVPHGICGQVVVGGCFYLVTTDAEETDEYFVTRVDARDGAVKIENVARLGFPARALAFDGERFWTNHREADQIVAFTLPR